MGRCAEQWEEIRQERQEWDNDPVAQEEYQQWLDENEGTWEQRYPSERRDLDWGLQQGDEHGF